MANFDPAATHLGFQNKMSPTFIWPFERHLIAPLWSRTLKDCLSCHSSPSSSRASLFTGKAKLKTNSCTSCPRLIRQLCSSSVLVCDCYISSPGEPQQVRYEPARKWTLLGHWKRSTHQKSAKQSLSRGKTHLFCRPEGRLHRCLPRSHAQQAPPCWGYKVAFLWNAGGQTFRFWKLGKFYIVQQVSGFFNISDRRRLSRRRTAHLSLLASRSDSSRVRMSPSLTGPWVWYFQSEPDSTSWVA